MPSVRLGTFTTSRPAHFYTSIPQAEKSKQNSWKTRGRGQSGTQFNIQLLSSSTESFELEQAMTGHLNDVQTILVSSRLQSPSTAPQNPLELPSPFEIINPLCRDGNDSRLGGTQDVSRHANPGGRQLCQQTLLVECAPVATCNG